MAVVITILKGIGIALLVVLVLVVLLLLVPIRYHGSFRVEDPKPRESVPDYGVLFREHAVGAFGFSWFGFLVRGGMTIPGEPVLMVRVLFWRFDVLEKIRTLSSKKTPPENRDAEKEQPPGSWTEKLQTALAKGKGVLSIFRKVLRLWNRRFTKRATDQIRRVLGRALPAILPGHWQVRGTLGLGDPAAGARIYEFLGILWPLVEGHVSIEVLPLAYQMDASLSFRGRIRLGTLLLAALRLVWNKDVRRLFHGIGRIRKAVAAVRKGEQPV